MQYPETSLDARPRRIPAPTPTHRRADLSLQAVEGAKRRFFEKEAIAKAYVKRLAQRLGDYHLQSLGLSDSQKLEASECFARLAGINGSLRTAVDFYLAHQDEAKRSVSIGVLVKEFLATKTQDAMSRKYLADLRSKLNRFAHHLGEMLVCDLTTSDLETWIRGLNVGAVSMESYRRSIGVALEFARRHGYAKTNPAADVKFAKKPTGEVTILTPAELRIFLTHCAPSIIPYVTICAFAGLRPSEAAALDWSDVHFDLEQIEVKAKHSKTRRHRLPILKSAEALALEMGNSPDIIFRHYRRPMAEQTGLEYFSIVPPALDDPAALKPEDSDATV